MTATSCTWLILLCPRMHGISNCRRADRRLYGICSAVLICGLVATEAAAQPTWCGGHSIEWAGGPPRAFSVLADESSSALTIEQPAWLIRDRWDGLVFNAFDNPPPEGRQTQVLERGDVSSIRICMQSPETSEVGQLLEPYSDASWWRFHIRRWTGVSWNGEILIADCTGEPARGWIQVRAARGNEIRTTNTAFAATRRDGEGGWVSSELVFQPEPPNPQAWEPLAIEGILAHELGHAMGFFHVSGDFPSWIMQVPAVRPWPEDESQHAQLAYQVGPNVLYPGLTPPSSLSNAATLSALELVGRTGSDDGFVYPLSLLPVFDSAIQSYTATATNNVTSVAVTARVNELNATVTVNGAAVPRGVESDAIELAVGDNILEVAVTAQDGATMLTYTVTVTRETAVSAPSNLTAVGGDGLAVLRWDAPENDGGAEITDYEYRTNRSNPWISTGSTNTTHTVSGLVNGTTYVFQVRAVNSIGKSSASNQAEVTPAATGDRIYYFPHLAVGASWQTTITLINYSPEGVTCQTDFLSDQGTALMVSFPSLGSVDSRIDVLPPGGAVHEETNVELSAPLAPGWARATCSGPVKASLLFRQHDSEGVPVAEAGVNATSVPATRFVTFAEQAPGQAGTGVAYANPSETAAVITFTAKDEAGRTLDSFDQTLMPGGHGAQNMAGLFDLPSFTGSLEITSTEPIVSLSLNAEAPPIFSSLPPGEPDAAEQGATTYYFPHLAVGASWQTTITLINYSSEEVSCRTDFISDHGSPLLVSFPGRGSGMNRTDELLPGGSVHEETDVDLNSMLVPGWAKAACTGPVKASLLFRQYGSEGEPVAEAGVNATTVPATRFVTFAEQAEGKTGTGVAYANPSATAAHVTFTAKDTEGRTLASVVRTVLPDGHDAQVMSVLFGFTSFSGSIEITSTEPIVSLSLNFEAAPVFSSLPPGEVD